MYQFSNNYSLQWMRVKESETFKGAGSYLFLLLRPDEGGDRVLFGIRFKGRNDIFDCRTLRTIFFYFLVY